MDWKRTDPDLAARVEKTAAQSAMRLLGKIETHAQENFAAASWILERRFPELFSRPEVQLNLIQQNNVTENRLSITISEQEVREIEDEAAPERKKSGRCSQRIDLERSATVSAPWMSRLNR